MTHFFDAELSAAVSIYHGFLKHSTFQQICDGTLELAQQRQLSKILVDTRALKVLKQESQQWIDEVWFPKAKQVRIRHMAFLVPEDIFGKMSMEATNKKVIQEGDIHIRYFESMIEARKWLQSV